MTETGLGGLPSCRLPVAVENLREAMGRLFGVDASGELLVHPVAGAAVLLVLFVCGLFGWKTVRLLTAVAGAVVGGAAGVVMGRLLAAFAGDLAGRNAALWIPLVLGVLGGTIGCTLAFALEKMCMFILGGMAGAAPGVLYAAYGGDGVIYGTAAAFVGFLLVGYLTVVFMRHLVILWTSAIASLATVGFMYCLVLSRFDFSGARLTALRIGACVVGVMLWALCSRFQLGAVSQHRAVQPPAV